MECRGVLSRERYCFLGDFFHRSHMFLCYSSVHYAVNKWLFVCLCLFFWVLQTICEVLLINYSTANS